jgi:hypothetical protein
MKKGTLAGVEHWTFAQKLPDRDANHYSRLAITISTLWLHIESGTVTKTP